MHSSPLYEGEFFGALGNFLIFCCLQDVELKGESANDAIADCVRSNHDYLVECAESIAKIAGDSYAFYVCMDSIEQLKQGLPGLPVDAEGVRCLLVLAGVSPYKSTSEIDIDEIVEHAAKQLVLATLGYRAASWTYLPVSLPLTVFDFVTVLNGIILKLRNTSFPVQAWVESAMRQWSDGVRLDHRDLHLKGLKVVLAEVQSCLTNRD